MYFKEQSTDNIDVSRTVSKICKKNNIMWVDHKFILKNIPARLAYNHVEILTPNNFEVLHWEQLQYRTFFKAQKLSGQN